MIESSQLPGLIPRNYFNTYRRTPLKVTVSKKSQASSASAWERRNLAVDPGLPEDLPHVRGGDPDLQDEQFAVDGR